MSLARLPLLTVLPLLAAGCCCPELSGRYCEIGQAPPLAPAATAPCACDPAPAVRCGPEGMYLGPPPLLAWLHGGHGAGGMGLRGPVPSEQHDDYLSPLPKFHPLPTRPVFEPQAEYGQPVLVDATEKEFARRQLSVVSRQ